MPALRGRGNAAARRGGDIPNPEPPMKKLLLPLLALAALALPASAITDQELRAIVPNGFSRASVMSVNAYNGTAPLTNFPVLVKISDRKSVV